EGKQRVRLACGSLCESSVAPPEETMAEPVDRTTLIRAVTEAVDSGRLKVLIREAEDGNQLLLSGRLTLATIPLFEQLRHRGSEAAVTVRAADLVGDGAPA